MGLDISTGASQGVLFRVGGISFGLIQLLVQVGQSLIAQRTRVSKMLRLLDDIFGLQVAQDAVLVA